MFRADISPPPFSLRTFEMKWQQNVYHTKQIHKLLYLKSFPMEVKDIHIFCIINIISRQGISNDGINHLYQE